MHILILPVIRASLIAVDSAEPTALILTGWRRVIHLGTAGTEDTGKQLGVFMLPFLVSGDGGRRLFSPMSVWVLIKGLIPH
jgi:hypothetical protein